MQLLEAANEHCFTDACCLFKEIHQVLILIVTGIAVVLVVLETAIPYLRGTINQERDQEDPDGKTVHLFNLLSEEGILYARPS